MLRGFACNDGWDGIKEAGFLLNICVRSDGHVLIEYARDNSLKILAIGPERPRFLTEDDYYLPGRADFGGTLAYEVEEGYVVYNEVLGELSQ